MSRRISLRIFVAFVALCALLGSASIALAAPPAPEATVVSLKLTIGDRTREATGITYPTLKRHIAAQLTQAKKRLTGTVDTVDVVYARRALASVKLDIANGLKWQPAWDAYKPGGVVEAGTADACTALSEEGCQEVQKILSDNRNLLTRHAGDGVITTDELKAEAQARADLKPIAG